MERLSKSFALKGLLLVFTLFLGSIDARRGGRGGRVGGRGMYGYRSGGRRYHRGGSYPGRYYRGGYRGRYGRGWGYGYRPGFWMSLGYPLFASGAYYNYARRNEWNEIVEDLKDEISDLKEQLRDERQARKREKLENKLEELDKHYAYALRKAGD